MTHAIGDRTCAVVGCTRRVETHAEDRCVHSRCPDHERSALSDAFTDAPVAPDSEPIPVPAAFSAAWTESELAIAHGYG